MTDKFDSCSYSELTNCVKSRLNNLREFKKISANQVLKDYPNAKITLRLSTITQEAEIRTLLKLRKKLKKSGARNLGSIIE